MNAGKQFEQDFKGSIPMYAFHYRFKDGTASWSDNFCPRCKTPLEKTTRFQAQNICDYMIFNNPDLFFLELKSTQSKSLAFDAVRKNQKKEMTEANRRKGVNAGIIVNFRKVEKTYFMSIDMFNECEEKLDRKSIPIDIFETYGTIIHQEKKKVHWKYDVDKFLKEYNKVSSSMF
jgi:recombination protein U